jgi:subtilisin family serine protease
VRTAEQPVLQQLGVPAAWQRTRGSGVTVGVLDTGVGGGAADLAGSVSSGPDYAAGVDPPGYQPPHLHGTYIASLIAGHGSGPGRAGGVIGVAPAARILSVRVLPDDQEPGLRVYNDSPRYTDAVALGVRYAARHGAGVINMSLGSTTPTSSLRSAIAEAISRGIVVVAAAGNGGSAGGQFSPYSYPASFPGVIAVAAVGGSGSRAGFSDHNASVVIAAPGVGVVGAAPGGEYLQASGTSPASALVAGVAALIRAAYPRLPPALVAQALITSARGRPARGYSPDTGFGEVDAPAALQAATRLAAGKPATGAAPSARAAAGPPGAIQVVHRDTARIVTFAGISAAGALGFLATLGWLAVLARPGRRAQRPGQPVAGSGTWPGSRPEPWPGSRPEPWPPPQPGAGYPGQGNPGGAAPGADSPPG